MEALAADNEAELNDLSELVGRKSAVPKERVYPMFEALARKWTDAEEVVMHMGALLAILGELAAFATPAYARKLQAKYVEEALRGHGEQAAADSPVKDGEAAAPAPATDSGGEEGGGAGAQTVAGDKLVAALSADSTEAVHVFRADNPEIVGMAINLASFCPVTIVERDNLLLPGNPSIGFVLYQGKLYAFVDVEVCACVRVHGGMCVFVSLSLFLSLSLCVCVCMHAFMHVCMCLCVCVSTCVCAHASIYIS